MMKSLAQLWTLARQYPFCGACGALSAVLLVASLVLSQQLFSLTAQQRLRQVESDAVNATLISAPQLRQEFAFVQQTVLRIDANLASEENVADNVNYFYKMGETSQALLELRSFNVAAAPSGAGYIRVPFSLRVSGTFLQVAAFVHAVETGPRLSSVTNLSLRKKAGTSLIVADFNVDLLGKK